MHALPSHFIMSLAGCLSVVVFVCDNVELTQVNFIGIIPNPENSVTGDDAKLPET
jgi:hypothetical protein